MLVLKNGSLFENSVLIGAQPCSLINVFGKGYVGGKWVEEQFYYYSVPKNYLFFLHIENQSFVLGNVSGLSFADLASNNSGDFAFGSKGKMHILYFFYKMFIIKGLTCVEGLNGKINHIV